jgi:hypothetical protein
LALKRLDAAQTIGRLYIQGVISIMVIPEKHKVYVLCRPQVAEKVKGVLAGELEEIKTLRNGLLFIRGRF